MVTAAAKKCGGCLAKHRSYTTKVTTPANLRAEEITAAGSATAYHANAFKANVDAAEVSGIAVRSCAVHNIDVRY
jgi:hypothetical protein